MFSKWQEQTVKYRGRMTDDKNRMKLIVKNLVSYVK